MSNNGDPKIGINQFQANRYHSTNSFIFWRQQFKTPETIVSAKTALLNFKASQAKPTNHLRSMRMNRRCECLDGDLINIFLIH